MVSQLSPFSYVVIYNPYGVGTLIFILWMRKLRPRKVLQWACMTTRFPIHTAGVGVYALNQGALLELALAISNLSFSTALISARTDLSTGTSLLDQAAFKESTTALQSYP